MDAASEMTPEDFKREIKLLTDKLINFSPKKNHSMSKAKNARELGALRKNLSTKRMLSGQLKYVNKS
jgi:hypothetical protein